MVSTHTSLQLISPGPHRTLQIPATHAFPVAQMLPQPPQLLGSTVVSLQTPLHCVNVPHVPVAGTQAEAVQTCPVGQMYPHAPQLLASMVVSRQVVPHLVRPPPHVAVH